MKKTTPPPRKNILELLPELAARAVTTIRLHPRRAETALNESKIGGRFLWPADEPWPTCDLGHVDPAEQPWGVPPGVAIPAVPVLQLNASDFPEVPFYPGTNLCQLLWCPLSHDEENAMVRPFLFWRHTDQIGRPLEDMPSSPLARQALIPSACTIAPERVIEYPSWFSLPEEFKDRIYDWDISDIEVPHGGISADLYNRELSVCPGTKIGGEVNWSRTEPMIPICQCGNEMEHFLTIATSEADGGTYPRWVPLEDRETIPPGAWEIRWTREHIVDAIDLSLPLDAFHLFICRRCPGWPIAAIR